MVHISFWFMLMIGYIIQKKNADVVVVISKDTGLEVNAGKAKCIFMSRDQNSGRSHNIKIDNSFFKRVEKFKYLEDICRS
jgi:hypothetical protein